MNKFNQQRGFTLIEFVMVIILLGIISVVATRMYVQSLRTAATAQDMTDALWQGQVAMQRMVRDIRMVRSASSVTTMSATSLIFTDITGASVTYTRSGTTLTRNSQALADGVSALTFSYLDKNNTVVATSANLAYIKISLTIIQNNTNYALTTGVYLRDLSS